MRRSLLTALLILLAAAMMASAAAPLDDARALIAAIRGRLNALSGELSSLADANGKDASALTDVSHHLREAADRQKQVAQLLADAIAKSLAQAKTDLAAATTAAMTANDAARLADIAAADAKADLPKRQAAIERSVNEARDALAHSQPFTQAAAAIKTAEASLERERTRLADATANDPTLSSLAKRLRDAEAAVKAAREHVPVDDAQLAQASNAWIAAQNAFSSAQSRAFSKDDAYSKAEKSLGAANRARAELIDASERSLITQPTVVAAQAAFREAQARVPATASAAADAHAKLEQATQLLATRQTTVDALIAFEKDQGETLAKAAVEVDRIAGSMNSNADAARSIAARVSTACD